MSEKDYAPLSTACVRALNDKLYEKRKAAAQEIEKMVKEFAAAKKTTQIQRLLKVLGQDFALSQNPHTRKGGLIGLAAVAVALGKDTSLYTNELIYPILACFSDSDLRVRYYACESLYNVVKVARGSVLPNFKDIFNALSKLSADPDQNVKNGSEHLDRLMKDIVTESLTFDLVEFMPLLREKIYTEHPFARQFIISWVTVLDAVPDIGLIHYLPEILDGLFRMLEDPTKEIQKMCDTLLGQFLRNIKRDPSKVKFDEMINILIQHSQSQNEMLQFTAIIWIKEFVQLSGRQMLPFASGILTAVLPCLAYDTESRKNTKETAITVNYSFMKLVTEEDDKDLPDSTQLVKSDDSSEVSTAQPQLDLVSVIEVLTTHLLRHYPVQTKVAVLGWIYRLHIKMPNKMFQHVDKLYPELLRTLSDSSDEVVQQDLKVLSEIVSSPVAKGLNINKDLNEDKKIKGDCAGMNPYFTKFIVSLLKLFSSDRHFLEDRGPFIIRQLCVLLNSEDIYRSLSQILLEDTNVKFASIMVENLNTILLTSSELFELRSKLKEMKNEESCRLFQCLYESWCHNPVATVALCLLTQNYQHACDLIYIFGNLEVTVDFLTEIDKLVQLIESPIFAYLRLELLQVPHNQHLIQALYGLLMLLPQTEAFHTLRRRLDCVPSLHLHCVKSTNEATKNCNKYEKHINFKSLLNHFISVQERHKQIKETSRMARVRNSDT